MVIKVIIVGAGPAGLLMAHHLCRQEGYDVSIFERHADPRELPASELRTYPIALQSNRGLKAINSIPGLQAALEKHGGTWTVGMCMHDNRNGNSARRIVRPHPTLAVDRNQLVLALLEELLVAPMGRESSLRIVFDSTVSDIHVSNKTAQVKTQGTSSSSPRSSTTSNGSNHNGGSKSTSQTLWYDVLVACDGSGSKLRESLYEIGLIHATSREVDDAYKSIFLSKESSDGSSPDLVGDLVHGWMLGDSYRAIAAPTVGTMSGVFTFPPGQDPFEKLEDGQGVLDFFKELSPGSFWKHITLDEASQILERPVSRATSVQVDRLHVGDSLLLLGDAAHAVSPSLGQGCNAALEDVQLFCDILTSDAIQHKWPEALEEFTSKRLADILALNELSTFANPRTPLMRFEWVLRNILNATLPSWMKKCCLSPLPMDLLSVPGLSYSEVLEKSRWWINRVKES